MTIHVWISAASILLVAFFGYRSFRARRRIKSLEQKLATRDGIIDEKCLEIYELEQANTNLDARNARLHHDLKAMRERLPMLAGELAASVVLDEDVARPYIPDYDDPWKDEMR